MAAKTKKAANAKPARTVRGDEFTHLQRSEKTVPPPRDFSAAARIRSLAEYRQLYKLAQSNPDA